MPRSLTVKISCFYILPTIVFAACAALCIIGNLLYSMKSIESNTQYTFSWWTWGVKGCSVSGSCVLYGALDFDKVVGSSSDCVSWIQQIRAAEAFGILTSLLSGISTIGSVALLFYQQLLTFPRVVIIGKSLSMLLVATCLAEFVVMVTLKDRACIVTRRLTTTTFEAGSFMYIGAVFLAMLNTFLYHVIGRCETPDKPSAGRNVPVPERPGDGAYSVSAGRPSTEMSGGMAQAYRGAASNRSDSEYRVGTPSQPRGSPSSPVAQPATSNMMVGAVPVSRSDETAGPLPEGADWELDADSGLLWSEDRKLFFDRGSGQFYDPESEQWYDPEEDRWYEIGNAA